MVTKSKIAIYCKCEICLTFFEVTKVKRSKYCSQKCRQKAYRNKQNNQIIK